MVPRSSCATSRGSRRPRTRGDGPLEQSWHYGFLVSAPHSRGWSPHRDAGGARDLVGPARTGWSHPLPAGPKRATSATLARGWSRGDRHRIGGCVRRPRTRGDGPMAHHGAPGMPQSAPHARGWSERHRCRVGPRRGGPARAMIPPWSPGVPGRGGVSPARAGMVPSRSRRRRARTRRSRTRGDGPIFTSDASVFTVSAPHARGWSRVQTGLVAGLQVGPAHAGMVPGFRPGCGVVVRGPARAGMVPCVASSIPRASSRPRTRGDGPLGGAMIAGQDASAPHGMVPASTRYGCTTTSRLRTRRGLFRSLSALVRTAWRNIIGSSRDQVRSPDSANDNFGVHRTRLSVQAISAGRTKVANILE
jgi:hypothetical protein